MSLELERAGEPVDFEDLHSLPDRDISFTNDESFVNFLRERKVDTPDFIKIRDDNSDAILVFVYGTLKRKYGNHRLIKEGLYVGEATTRNQFCRRHNNGFPVMSNLPKNDIDNSFKGVIRGEAYIVDLAMISAMDRLEANGRMYQRERTPILLTDQKYLSKDTKTRCTPVAYAWAYFGMDDFWSGSSYVKASDSTTQFPYHQWG